MAWMCVWPFRMVPLTTLPVQNSPTQGQLCQQMLFQNSQVTHYQRFMAHSSVSLVSGVFEAAVIYGFMVRCAVQQRASVLALTSPTKPWLGTVLVRFGTDNGTDRTSNIINVYRPWYDGTVPEE